MMTKLIATVLVALLVAAQATPELSGKNRGVEDQGAKVDDGTGIGLFGLSPAMSMRRVLGRPRGYGGGYGGGRKLAAPERRPGKGLVFQNMDDM
ncbi:hypothetical protein BSKO_13545 [Bryopsis sp. KO-2023]|nr:hypothetical protein BSKO_13545 [Bryopsis sp. KO-2023]